MLSVITVIISYYKDQQSRSQKGGWGYSGLLSLISHLFKTNRVLPTSEEMGGAGATYSLQQEATGFMGNLILFLANMFSQVLSRKKGENDQIIQIEIKSRERK